MKHRYPTTGGRFRLDAYGDLHQLAGPRSNGGGLTGAPGYSSPWLVFTIPWCDHPWLLGMDTSWCDSKQNAPKTKVHALVEVIQSLGQACFDEAYTGRTSPVFRDLDTVWWSILPVLPSTLREPPGQGLTADIYTRGSCVGSPLEWFFAHSGVEEEECCDVWDMCEDPVVAAKGDRLWVVYDVREGKVLAVTERGEGLLGVLPEHVWFHKEGLSDWAKKFPMLQHPLRNQALIENRGRQQDAGLINSCLDWGLAFPEDRDFLWTKVVGARDADFAVQAALAVLARFGVVPGILELILKAGIRNRKEFRLWEAAEIPGYWRYYGVYLDRYGRRRS